MDSKAASFAYVFLVGWLAVTLVLQSILVVFSKKYAWWLKLNALIWMGIVVYLGLNRTIFLPFLGPTVFPYTVLKAMQPIKANNAMRLSVDESAMYAVYWAAAETGLSGSPKQAYKNYENAGVAVVREGVAELSLACPVAYSVPIKGELPKHVHYRLVYRDGWMGPVENVPITCV